MTGDVEEARPRRWEWWALAAVLAAATVVRVINLDAGLPGANFLNPDEHNVTSRAVGMVHTGTANPNWFLYPSLFFSLVAGALLVARVVIDVPAPLGFAAPEAYALDPSPYLLTGRVVSTAAGVALVLATYLLGRRVRGPAAGLGASAIVAASPLAVSYSHFAVTDMTMTALLTFGLWQLVVAAQSRRTRPLLVAAALIGLATSTKYNAGLGVLPLLAAAWWLPQPPARWHDRLRGVLAAGMVALATFVAGTPFAVLDAGTFWSDFARQNAINAAGWLGFEHAPSGFIYNVVPLLRDAVGVVVLVFAAAGIAVAVARRRRAHWILVPYLVGSYAYVSTWDVHFDRYLLPLLPVVAVAAAEGVMTCVRRTTPTVPRALAIGAAIALVLAQPVVDTVRLLDRYSDRDPRLDLAGEIERVVPAGARIAVDPLTPLLFDTETAARIATTGVPRKGFQVIALRTPQPGTAADPARDLAELRRRGVRWVVTSDDVARRVGAAADVHPDAARFYAELSTTARLRASAPERIGPGARLWDLGPPE